MLYSKHHILRLFATLATALVLSACTSGESHTSAQGNQPENAQHNSTQVASGANTASDPVTSPPDPTEPAGEPAASWTTLGTRQTTSHPADLVTQGTAAEWTDYDPAALYPNTATLPLKFITMRDGTQLAAYVTLPADENGNPILNKKFPTILIQTSYNGGTAQFIGSIGTIIGAADPYMVKHGYASVAVDVRGTGQSQGSWQAFGKKEQADYAEVVQWVTKQPWSNGKIGVYGVSYLGITAIFTASQNHPAVKAAFATVPIGDAYRDIVFTGGMFNPTFIPLWLTLVSALGVTNPCILTHPVTCLTGVLNHLAGALTKFQVPIILKGLTGNAKIAYDSPEHGAFWAVRSPLEDVSKINVPTFIVGGLSDLFQRSEPMTYAKIQDNTTAKLLIGPWTHVEAAVGAGLPADGVPILKHIKLMWFNQYLKGMDVGANKLPNVTQYVQGYGHYVTTTDWPHPKASAKRLYLRGDLSLSTTKPSDDAPSHKFVNFPAEGLCSRSLSQWTAGILGYIPLPCFEHNNSTDRWAVVYQTRPLNEAMYINGPIEADLWISSSAKDAVLSVRVSDVAPNGVATALTNGVQLASMRAVDKSRSRYLDGEMIQPWHPYTKKSKKPLEPGKPTLVRVEVFPTSALIPKGHSLRISISANNIAQALPALPSLLKTLPSFTTTIYSEGAHPSSVVLPLVPTSALDEYQQK